MQKRRLIYTMNNNNQSKKEVIYDMMIRISSLALLYFLCKYCVSVSIV